MPPPGIPDRPLTGFGRRKRTSQTKGATMSDFLFLALGIGAFAAFAAYARLIAHI